MTSKLWSKQEEHELHAVVDRIIEHHDKIRWCCVSTGMIMTMNSNRTREACKSKYRRMMVADYESHTERQEKSEPKNCGNCDSCTGGSYCKETTHLSKDGTMNSCALASSDDRLCGLERRWWKPKKRK